MNCPHCEYLLFNLTQPVCPECGREFDVEQYRFAPGAVTFHCPHCNQAYYGNDAQGLPSPREFTCAQCENPVTLRDLRVVPSTPEVRGARTDVTPWDERLKIGRVPAWWRTTGLVLSKPTALFRQSWSMSIGDAWRFAAISMYVGVVPYLLLMVGVLGLMLGAGPGIFGGGGGMAAPQPVGWMLLGGAASLAVVAVIPLLYGGVMALAIQLGLLVCAPARQPLRVTFRTVLLAMAPYCFYWVPCVGSTLAFVWFIVAAIHGMCVVHGIDGWRAAAVVLWMPILMIGLYVFVLATDLWLLI
jgi:hypothetical protein